LLDYFRGLDPDPTWTQSWQTRTQSRGLVPAEAVAPIPTFALGAVFVAAYAGAVLAEAHGGEGAHNPVLIRLRPARLFHTQRLFEDFRDGHTLVLCCDVFEIVVDRPVPGITLISDRRSDFGLTTSSAQFVHKQRWQVCP